MTEADFWRQIADGDDTARLALADFLEERGDPRCAWVRDDDIFAHMLPDGRDPVPSLVENLAFDDGALDPDMLGCIEPSFVAPYAKLGPLAAPAAKGLAQIAVYAETETDFDVEDDPAGILGNRCADFALAAIGPAGVPAILGVAKDAPEDTYTRAARGLRLVAAEAVVPLRKALSHRSHQVRGVAALALVDADPAAAMPVLVEQLRRKAPRNSIVPWAYADGIARAAAHVAPPLDELRPLLAKLDETTRHRLYEAHPDLGFGDLPDARRLLAKPSPSDADMREARRLVEPHLSAHSCSVRDAARRLMARLEDASKRAERRATGPSKPGEKTEADFWARIASGDDAARLALADWLDTRGDARASWVRDADICRHMLPDGRDPVPTFVALLTFDDDFLDPDMVGSHDPSVAEVVARLGPAGAACARGLAQMTVYARNEGERVTDEEECIPDRGCPQIDAALAAIGPACVEAILSVAESAPEEFYRRACRSLRLMGGAAAPALRAALSHPAHQVSGTAALALADVDPAAAMPALVEALRREAMRSEAGGLVYAGAVVRAARLVAPPWEMLAELLPELADSVAARVCEAHPDLGTGDLPDARRLLAKASPTGDDLQEARRRIERRLADRYGGDKEVARRLMAWLESLEART